MRSLRKACSEGTPHSHPSPTDESGTWANRRTLALACPELASAARLLADWRRAERTAEEYAHVATDMQNVGGVAS